MQGTWWVVGTGLGSEEGWADWELGDVMVCCRCWGGKEKDKQERWITIKKLWAKVN